MYFLFPVPLLNQSPGQTACLEGIILAYKDAQISGRLPQYPITSIFIHNFILCCP